MKFTVIDKAKWDRKECFEHFINNASCTYSITVNVDITNLIKFMKENSLRIYPVFTWIASRCLNNHNEFKMGYDQNGNVGYFDYISPSYSVLNDKTKVMADLCTEYNDDFKKFYDDMVYSLDKYKEDKTYSTPFEPNFYIVSCLPWFTYTSFNVNNEGSQPFLFPMVTWGKYFEDTDKTYKMPVTIQIHHAAADGYHCSLFYADMQEICSEPEKYLL